VLLEVDQVGVEDNLFEIGGDSLTATRLALQIRTSLDIQLPLRTIFETPTVAGLAVAVEAAREAAVSLPAAPIRPLARDGRLPLSAGQRRLWFADRLDPGNTVYTCQEAVRLAGPLDVPRLERCLNELVARHEVLRTTFAEIDGMPTQVIAAAQELRIAVTDLAWLDGQEQETEVRRLISEEVAVSFSLTDGPLIRARILQIGTEEHVLILTMHHIITDAWSMAVFIKDMGALYDAHSHASPSPLEPLTVQYADFAAWEHEQLAGAAMDEQLTYWKRQLRGPVPALSLPEDHPGALAQPNNGARQAFTISTALTAALRDLCQGQNVTLFMTLLAAWQTLLHYYSGQDDILVGSPTANRDQQETQELIGFFVNTLVFRADLSGDPAFSEVLGRVRQVALDAYTHRALPFDKLVEESWLERRELDRNPLFRTWFVLQNVPMPALKLGDALMTPLEANTLMAVHDLKLIAVDDPESLECAIDYRTHLFEPATIRRMSALYETLLRNVVAAPDTTLGRLMSLLAEEERSLRDVEARDERELQAQRLKRARRQAIRVPAR
jgi:acyl carrier protein